MKRLCNPFNAPRVFRSFNLAIVILVVTALCFSMSGCTSKPQSEGNSETSDSESGTQTKTPVRVGIVQIADHSALDAARDGFKQALIDLGYKEGETISFDIKSAGGEPATALTISQKFVADKVDLILAIATPAAQAAATATTDIPILFTAVTDPVTAKLVESIQNPNTNLTGTSDLTPVVQQIRLLKELKPSINRVGIIYNSGEPNSVVQAGIAREACEELGLTLIEATPTNVSEVTQAAQSLVGRVDAIYVPTCNTVVSGIEGVIATCEKNSLPLVTGESAPVEIGALATDGIDYFTLGYETGKMAAEIIGGAEPSETPVRYLENLELVINLQAAQRIGLDIPESIMNRADRVIE